MFTLRRTLLLFALGVSLGFFVCWALQLSPSQPVHVQTPVERCRLLLGMADNARDTVLILFADPRCASESHLPSPDSVQHPAI